MKRRANLTATCLLLSTLLFGASTWSQDEAKSKPWTYDEGVRFKSEGDNFELHLTNRVNFLAVGTQPELGVDSESFDIPHYKLRFDGRAFQHWRFGLQTDLANGSNSNNLLEDAWVQYSKHALAKIWMGQGKIFFGRQMLASSGELQFVERSIATEEFRHTTDGSESRDVGVALVGQNLAETYGYQIGVYNGNGTNKDAKDNSDYMAVGRLVITPLGAFPESEGSPDRPEKPKLALGVAVMTLTKGTGALQEEVRDSTGGLELAFKVRGLGLVGEFFTRSADLPLSIPGDEVDTDGWYLQAGYTWANGLEIAGRYSEVGRDIPDDDETEFAGAINYYFSGHRHKIQADYRRLEFEGIQATPDIDRDEFRVQVQLAF